jgi:uncharacterized protein (DUF111 family)
MLPGDAGYEQDTVFQIETNLDDLSPELLGHVTGLLLDAGALDVWVTPVQMKKQRPGMVLSVLADVSLVKTLSDLIFTHTSAFGLRMSEMIRWKLRRDFVEVETPFGRVSVKRGFRGDTLLQIAPEFESCKAVALKNGCALQRVYDAARTAARALGKSGPAA